MASPAYNKQNDERFMLKWKRSGAIRLPEKDAFTRLAQLAESRGDNALAGIMRVEASNSLARVGMKKAHKPNLGPYTADNPAHCADCGKPRSEWTSIDEVCVI